MLDHSQSLRKVKIKLMAKDPFLATLALDLPTRFTDEVPTAATDGLELLVNPSFWADLSDAHKIGVFAHEVLHVAYMHSFRRKTRDPWLWNVAGDYVINLVLKDENYQLPDGCLYDTQYRNMSTEEVYEQLIKNNPPMNGKGNGNGNGDPLGSDVLDSPTDKNTQQQVASKISNAKLATASSGKGIGPKGNEISRAVDSILRPQLPWHSILLQYCTDLKNQEYSWSRPNRRYQDVYLPSLQNTEYGMGGINVFIDVSGSIDDKTLNVFLAELKNIWESCNPDWVDLMAFSTKLNPATRIEDEWNAKFDTKSTGGTSGSPVLNYINSCKEECVNIIFTDGYIDTPHTNKKNVFWIILDNPSFNCPYGRILHLES